MIFEPFSIRFNVQYYRHSHIRMHFAMDLRLAGLVNYKRHSLNIQSHIKRAYAKHSMEMYSTSKYHNLNGTCQSI